MTDFSRRTLGVLMAADNLSRSLPRFVPQIENLNPLIGLDALRWGSIAATVAGPTMTVDGAPTTHYSVTVDLHTALRRANGANKTALLATIGSRVGTAAGSPSAGDSSRRQPHVWLNDRGHVVQLRMPSLLGVDAITMVLRPLETLMAGIQKPFLGGASVSAFRGLQGGGAPWIVSRATGSLTSEGHLVVRVRGLVLDPAAVPAPTGGTNPLPSFMAIVSGFSTDPVQPVNLLTPLFPASPAGDADIEARLILPHPFFAPIVFVTSLPLGTPPAPRWLAVTGQK